MKVLNEYTEPEGFSSFKQLFIETGILKKYKKGEFCFLQGRFASFLGYIQSGSFRYLCYNSKEEEQLVGYSFEDDFVVDYASFQMQKEATISAQAVKDSVVFTLSYEEINSFFDNCSNKNLRSILAESFLSDIHRRLLSFYCDSPEERYMKLIYRHPEILSLLNLKEIASLINVTPETLSRIRKKMVKL